MKPLAIQVGPGHRVEFGVSKRFGPFIDVITEDCSIGTPILRTDLVELRKWLNTYFAKGCESHGVERCIECENRCQWCGDDGDMTQRDGDRVCENCAWSLDEGEL